MALLILLIHSSRLPILIFPQVDAPSFRKGYPTNLAFVLLTISSASLVWYLHRRDMQRAARVENNMDGSGPGKSDEKDPDDTTIGLGQVNR